MSWCQSGANHPHRQHNPRPVSNAWQWPHLTPSDHPTIAHHHLSTLQYTQNNNKMENLNWKYCNKCVWRVTTTMSARVSDTPIISQDTGDTKSLQPSHPHNSGPTSSNILLCSEGIDSQHRRNICANNLPFLNTNIEDFTVDFICLVEIFYLLLCSCLI